MANLQKFEDIVAWQKARELTRQIYRASRLGDFAKDFALRDQIRRAAISITSNIAEGFERGGNKELVQFLALAKGSCGEVRSQLYVALDELYLDPQLWQQLHGQCMEIARLLDGFINYLRDGQMKGRKYSPAAPRSSKIPDTKPEGR